MKIAKILMAGVLVLGASQLMAKNMENSNSMWNKGNKEYRMGNKDINEVKQDILNKIDVRIQKLNEAKKCINNSNSFEELKNCRPDDEVKRNKNGIKQKMNNK